MNELVDRIATNTGVAPPVAERAVAIILDFLRKEGPTETVDALIARLPGVEALAASGEESGSGGGIMGVANRLMGAGLGMFQIQSVAREVLAYARETVGEDAVGEIVAAIPGLSQFA